MIKKTIILLSLLNMTLWYAIFFRTDNDLHVMSCNVGQGDGLLIQHKSTQIVVDGGPNSKIVDCLGKYMPFWDRQVELVFLTHPQQDHYGGLIEVFDRYNVKYMVANELDSSSESYQVLKNKLDTEGSHFLEAKSSQDLKLGLIYLDILHPSESFLLDNYDETREDKSVLGVHTSSNDPNDFSVTFELSYSNFKMLFTGDLSPDVADQLINSGLIEDIDVLKVPHHGSRNGLTQNLLDNTKPELSVISVGKNQWGHPHQEVLDMLSTAGTKILRTDQSGDIEIVTDGKSWWVD